MRVLKLFNGAGAGSRWVTNGDSTGIQWGFNGNSKGIQWEFNARIYLDFPPAGQLLADAFQDVKT